MYNPKDFMLWKSIVCFLGTIFFPFFLVDFLKPKPYLILIKETWGSECWTLTSDHIGEKLTEKVKIKKSPFFLLGTEDYSIIVCTVRCDLLN